HEDYIARRDKAAAEAGLAPLPRGMQSAGGMPSRVKCLHALVAHELAVPGINPLGREALDALPEWWAAGPCVDVTTLEGADDRAEDAATTTDGADAGKRHGNGGAVR